MLGFAGAIHDAPHHSDVHVFYAGILGLPGRHLLAKIGLYAIGKFLENSRGGAATAGACNDHRCEFAQAHRLQNFLRHYNLFRAIAAGLGGKRYADGVADPRLQQYRQRSGRGHNALAAHTSLGQSEMQRIIASPRKLTVDGDEVLHS